MKTVIIYRSQTGFTKQYAEWIAEQTQADCYSFEDAKNKDFSNYDIIVYGGWCCAGSIKKLNWFQERIPKWEGKKLIVFAVGASPIENPDVEKTLHKIFTDEEREKVKVFYCPGGFRYDKMPVGSKLLMKMFESALKTKKDKTEEEEHMADMIGNSYDISDKKYIIPIVSYIIGDER